MMSRSRLLAAFAVAMLAPPAYAGSCPEPIGGASRLVLVTTSTMNTTVAKVQLFTRALADKPWDRIGAAEPAVVGQAGLGWGYTFLRFKRDGEPEKVEGDKRTPAGFFSIGSSFGFAASSLPGYILIKAGETVCVEDPSSPFYNRIRKRAEIGATVKADDMRSTPLYRRGLFVEYPSDRASRRGSCIFIHIWSAPNKGTAGCIGLPEARVKALQEFSQAGAVLAVLPESALDRFLDCLPTARPPL
jgi:D-alanyl-D-alanine dipeptidase